VKALEEAEKTLDRWYELIENVPLIAEAEPGEGFMEALGDDLNTPLATSELYTLFSSNRAGLARAGVSRTGWDVHDPRVRRLQLHQPGC